MDQPLALGRWMRRLRAELDLTQEALAEQVGCAHQTIRSLERGTRRPSRALAERLVAVLQVPAEDQADFVRLARLPASPPPPHPVPHQQSRPQGDDAGAPGAGGVSSGRTGGRQAATEGTAAVQQASVLTTKLYVPQPRPELVPRPRLRARLDRGLAGPLTVIAAAAGFGKTTLLADWLATAIQQPDSSIRHGQVAWLSLDAADSDPVQFLRYLVAALQTLAPEVGRTLLAVLQAPQAPPIATLLPLLANDLVALPNPSILVLDDYHVLDAPAVHQALAYLLDNLPPQLHLVIATRVDPPLPLSRLRARGQLTELRAHELRFTPEEAARFLREVMALPLSVEDVAALAARTEGWIAGLQLAALSLQDRPPEQMARFIDAFAGSHRFVVDYLVDEVLARQPAHLQTFLLETSILERLCGPLCDAVMLGDVSPVVAGGEIGKQAFSQVLLEELERANLFIVPLDDDRRWYRYHHLFAQVLHQHLTSGVTPAAVAALHRRAGGWFEGQGLAEEAVQHTLAAGDRDCAARLIEEHDLGRLMLRGQVHTVLGWLNTLPEALLYAHPYLLHYHALGLFSLNQLEAAEIRAQMVEEVLGPDTLDDRSRTILGYATGLRAAIAYFRGDVGRCLTLSDQVLEMLPTTEVSGRTTARMFIAWAFVLRGNVSPANERGLVAAVAEKRQSGELRVLFNGIITLAELQRRRGRLRQAAVTYREAAQVVPEPGGPRAMLNGADYYFGLGDLLREWNDLDAAEDLLAQGRELVRRMLLAQVDGIAAGYIALARLQQARGESSAAGATLNELEQLAHERSFPAHLLARGAAARAQLVLAHGNLSAAVRWADMSDLYPDDDLSYPREPEYLTLTRVRIAQGRRDPAGPYLRDALRLLDRLLEAAEAGGRMASVIEILIIRAMALQAQGDANTALAALEGALTLAAPEGYQRVFVDEGAPIATLLAQGLAVRDWGVGDGKHHHDVREHVQQLQAVFHVEGIDPQADLHLATSHPRSLTPGGEPLTERELEVLRLLASGCSNQAIAHELVVAVGTVKRHVNSILGKLQAQSRLEAVARARDLQIV